MKSNIPCSHCQDIIDWSAEIVKITFLYGTYQQHEVFCNDSCRDTWIKQKISILGEVFERLPRIIS